MSAPDLQGWMERTASAVEGHRAAIERALLARFPGATVLVAESADGGAAFDATVRRAGRLVFCAASLGPTRDEAVRALATGLGVSL